MRLSAFVSRELSGNRPLARIIRPVVNRLLPKGPLPITVMSGAGAGLKLVIDPQREKFYWTGSYEPAVQRAISQLLRPGDKFWDIGAHIGFYSLIASRLVGSAGQVHAFEPFTPNLERLCASVALNDAQNVSVHSLALSERIGEATLYQADLSVMSTLIPERGKGEAQVVDCTTLDATLAALGAPTLIKIDVEGAEDLVLAGGQRLLGQHRVNLIVEFLTDAALKNAQPRLIGYRSERLDSTNWLMRTPDP